MERKCILTACDQRSDPESKKGFLSFWECLCLPRHFEPDVIMLNYSKLCSPYPYEQSVCYWVCTHMTADEEALRLMKCRELQRDSYKSNFTTWIFKAAEYLDGDCVLNYLQEGLNCTTKVSQ